MNNQIKYLATAAMWLALAVVIYKNQNALIFTLLLGMVATAIIIHQD